jgi:hypothetical protein
MRTRSARFFAPARSINQALRDLCDWRCNDFVLAAPADGASG